MDGIPTLDLWDLDFEEWRSSLNQPVQGNLLRGEEQRKNTNTPKEETPTETILNCSMWISSPQTQNVLTLAPCFTFLKTVKQ